MLLTREQLQERLFALHRASLELINDVSLETLLERIASTACEQAGAQYAAVGVLDEHGGLKQFIAVGMSDDEVKKMDHPPVGLGLLGELMNTDLPLRVPVIQDHPKSVGFPAHHPPMIPFLGVPIRAGDRQLGQIYLTNKVGGSEFDENDEMIIQMLAAYAATAISNARLYENTARLAVFEERDRIAMDLHDGIIQSIYGVGLGLENVQLTLDEDPLVAKERIHHAIDELNQAIRDIRTYILDLKPRQLGNDGLLSGIKRLITEYRANTFSEVNFTGPDELKEPPHAQSLALFHICQEALANVGKHAKAKIVHVAVWMTDERALLEIKDDGKGFDLGHMKTSIGHGLANMQTRAHAVGGDIDISSSIGDGTTILVWVPRK